MADKVQSDFKTIMLPQNLSAPAPAELREQLLMHKNDPIEIDASEVDCVSTLAIQVLLSASKDWEQRGVGFSISARSETFATGIQQLGLSDL